ncbi:NAD(P)-dependent dehydrogenase (short-subunit alcohol dehydrogenase family) [Peribacillus deserti]|uniref:NAD(P)-dependent dehydrogenase (Short-subunit alcohol dehydrogenase family) n=1 Tax=Peribacillus deserti TaxID=673318 RepID=A0ABS2QFB4_9BACI|nr:SDR family oxidoreductase [Peribacillus deserti]MBM7691660.1 NAD(P)-dependent dehydrogenase (short-subunit alcohol dehydrogenase family) [Peribacillus deserti]
MKILITGAGRGLGLELARAGGDRGHTILAGLRDQTKAEGLTQLHNRFPGRIHPLSMEVTNEASIAESATKAMSEFGSIDVIINNAGVLVERDKRIEDLDFAQLQFTMDVNLYGPMRVVKHFLPLLLKGQDQSIVNISSEAGSFHNAYGGDYPYAISKAALNMFSEQLKKYVKEKEINVYAIHPGWIKTDMGGDKAPGSPVETANNIMDIVEGKTSVKSDFAFIDHRGGSMAI